MVLMLDNPAAVTRVRSDIAGSGPPPHLGRTLARLGFPAGFGTPRYHAPPPVRPNRRRDGTAPDWQPL